jgi:hypothetical protein
MKTAKKNLLEPEKLKSIGTIATKIGVPERWLRNKVASGHVQSVRVGYNLFVPIAETAKIKKLAAHRRTNLAG